MTSDDIFKKLVKDFDETEGERLRLYPIDNVMTMSKVDKIIMDDDLINYLRNEFYGIYMGEPIPKVFSKALMPIAVTDGKLTSCKLKQSLK